MHIEKHKGTDGQVFLIKSIVTWSDVYDNFSAELL